MKKHKAAALLGTALLTVGILGATGPAVYGAQEGLQAESGGLFSEAQSVFDEEDQAEIEAPQAPAPQWSPQQEVPRKVYRSVEGQVPDESGIFSDGGQTQVYTLSHENILKEGSFGSGKIPDSVDPKLEQAVLEGVKAEKSYLDLTAFQIPQEEIDGIVSWILNENPSLFDVRFEMCHLAQGKVTILYVDYEKDEQTRKERQEKYQAALSQVLNQISPNLTDYDKVKAVHDYLVENLQYDQEGVDSNTYSMDAFHAYGVLVDKKGVCQGYTQAMKALMDSLSIPCRVLVSSDMSHTWNQVKLGDSWYHVDVTWDDPVPDVPGQVKYEYFLLSDETIRDKGHTGWTSPYEADSKKYETQEENTPEAAQTPYMENNEDFQ